MAARRNDRDGVHARRRVSVGRGTRQRAGAGHGGEQASAAREGKTVGLGRAGDRVREGTLAFSMEPAGLAPINTLWRG